MLTPLTTTAGAVFLCCSVLPCVSDAHCCMHGSWLVIYTTLQHDKMLHNFSSHVCAVEACMCCCSAALMSRGSVVAAFLSAVGVTTRRMHALPDQCTARVLEQWLIVLRSRAVAAAASRLLICHYNKQQRPRVQHCMRDFMPRSR